MASGSCKSALLYYTAIIMFLQVQTLIYHDFDGLKTDEYLKYGILHIDGNLDRLIITASHSHILPIKIFYANIYEKSAKVADFCKNHRIYLKDKEIILYVDKISFGVLAQCLKNSSEPVNTDLTRLTLLALDMKVDKEHIEVLQFLGVNFGIHDVDEEMLNEYHKLGITVDVGVSAIDLDYNQASYDFDSFVQLLDEKCSTLTRSLFGYNLKLIVWVHCSGCPAESDVLLARFAYQWAEMRKVFVIPWLNVCFKYSSALEHNQCVMKTLYHATTTSPSLSIQNFHNGIMASEPIIETAVTFRNFDSIIFELDDNNQINHDDLLKLALVHSNLERNITWNLRWRVRNTFKPNQTQTLNYSMFLSIAKRHPGLIKKFFVVLPYQHQPPLDERNVNDTLRVMETLEVASTAMNISIILLIEYDHTEAVVDGSEDRLLNFSRTLNTSVGASINIPESSVNTRVLDEVRRNFKYSTDTILINYAANQVGKNKFADCFDFKKRWNSLKNWANIYGYYVVVLTHTSLQSSNLANASVCNGSCYQPWIKNLAVFGNDFVPENVTAGELRFLSNFQDTCVAMPKRVPSTPVKFNDTNAGVALNLTLEKYSSLGHDEIAELLQLIHFKFSNIEVVTSQPSSSESLQKAIQLVKVHSNSTDVRKRRYYLSIPSKDIPQQASYEYFDGVHISLCFCKNDQIVLERLRNAPDQNIGISIPYEEAINPDHHGLWKDLVILTDYVVIHVNLAEALLSGLNYLGNESIRDLNMTIQDYIKHYPQDIPPNPIFDNLRAVRFNIRRWNLKNMVYAKIAWPTIQNTRSTERTQKVWEYLRDFSNVFDFPFFIDEAFDNTVQRCTDRSDLQYGWWRLTSDKEVGNSANYIDKQAEFYDLETQRPNRTIKIPSKPSTTKSLPITEIGACVISILLVVIVVAAVVVYRLRLTLQMLLTKAEIREFEMGKTGPDSDNPDENDYCSIAYDKEKYEISKAALDLDSSAVVGSGNFGIVYKATIQNYEKPVAVKVPKICGKVELLSVLREIKLLSFVGEHENILKLVGAYTREVQKGIVYVITEFVENGSLLEYLRKIPNSKKGQEEVLLQLNRFCMEITKGMQYLSEKKVIHGDLSTRNVLLDSTNICKISDFGLSRKLYYMDLYVKQTVEPVPWRWMAVEALKRSELSLKTDIWSLGVTFWEIFSFAEEPYQSVSWDLEFSKKLIDGLRLPKPEMADQSVYEVMLSCWKIDPEERPNPEYFIDSFQSLRSLTYTQL